MGYNVLSAITRKTSLRLILWAGSLCPPITGAITCNIGDMLMRWSSDRLISNLHRVVMPSGEDAAKSRYSMAFFLQPDDSALIESDKYETVTAREMIQGRVRAYWPTTDKTKFRVPDKSKI